MERSLLCHQQSLNVAGQCSPSPLVPGHWSESTLPLPSSVPRGAGAVSLLLGVLGTRCCVQRMFPLIAVFITEVYFGDAHSVLAGRQWNDGDLRGTVVLGEARSGGGRRGGREEGKGQRRSGRGRRQEHRGFH